MICNEGDRISFTITTPLHTYAKSANTQQISDLISRGYNVDAKDARDRTPLMLAVTVSEDVSTIGFLLNKNADIYRINFQGLSALRMVIEKSHEWLATLTLKEEHLTILALFFGRVRSDFFVDTNSTVQKLQQANCPLALIPFMKSAAITQYFLEHRFDLSVQCVGGLTALHVAVLRQDLESVKLLVACGANLNDIDHHKQTALFAHYVNSPDTNEKIEILGILLNRGASLHKRRNDGVTPMEYLLKNGNRSTRLTVLQSDSFKKFRSNGERALHYLLQNENIGQSLNDEIKFLLNRGLNVNTRNDKGMSALTFAVALRRRAVVEFLMRNGAEVNWPEMLVKTPMLKYFACPFLNEYGGKRELWQKYYQRVVDVIFRYQLGINVKHLFKELNKGFRKKLDNHFFGQIVIAHLVIAEAAGKPIPDSTLRYIESKIQLNEHYDICRRRIKQLDNITVNGSVTLLQLLTESDDQIDTYICNQDFVSELHNLMSQKYYQNLYYAVIIRKRIECAIRTVELRKKCGRVICELTGLDMYGVDEHHYVVYKIISYLSKRDILNLFEGQPLLYVNPMSDPNTQRGLGNFVSKSIKKIFSRIVM